MAVEPQSLETASTADKPGTATESSRRVVAVGFFILGQCLFTWLFVRAWLVNLEARLDGSATLPVLLSAATAALVVGTVVVEVVLLARRRRDPVQVALVSMVLIQLASSGESALDS